MVDSEGESLNTVFQILAEWESQLKPLVFQPELEESSTPKPPSFRNGG
jgi:hypothetical protein